MNFNSRIPNHMRSSMPNIKDTTSPSAAYGSVSSTKLNASKSNTTVAHTRKVSAKSGTALPAVGKYKEEK